jgi:hypothetical protein
MKIHEAKVHKMRPTQITVGMLEVNEKKEMISKMNDDELLDFLRKNPIPAVLGPEGRMYLTDHHHLGKALNDLNIDRCFFIVQHDLSTVPVEKFFDVLATLELVHPYDANGQKRDCCEIPHHIEHLIDDPYRSLAGFVRKAGGYVKTNKAYTEFLWADYFRDKINIDDINNNLEKTIAHAVELAKKDAAKNLPGFIPDSQTPLHKTEHLNQNNQKLKTKDKNSVIDNEKTQKSKK